MGKQNKLRLQGNDLKKITLEFGFEGMFLFFETEVAVRVSSVPKEQSNSGQKPSPPRLKII